MAVNPLMQEMLPEVELALRQVVDGTVNPRVPELRSMLTYHMGWEGEGAGPEAQGKRIRPLLVLLSTQAAGGDWREALPAAAAVELLHNFSLIHDDIQDRSELRRGRPTVWVKWGIAQAINAGDVMFTQAFHALQNLDRSLPADATLEALRVLQQVCLQLTEGQYLDLSYESRFELTQADYWPMITGKTSALLGGCCELGALCAGASRETRAAFHEFGLKLGLAFQVLDDWLGIWGDAALIGKSTESDLVSGKKSLPVLFALDRGGAFARRWKQGSIQAGDLPEVIEMLKADGAEEFTLAEAQRLTDQALAALDRSAPLESTHNLRELTGLLLKRTH